MTKAKGRKVYTVVDRILQGSVIVNKNVTVEDTNL